MNLNFLHNYNPDPVIFSIGPLEIYWYGFLMSSAMLIGILLGQTIGKKYNIDKEKIFDLGVYLIVFGLLGARIYYLFLEYNYFLNNPLAIFKVWEGGLAIHGAIIGGLLAGYFYTKKHKINFFLTADIIAVSLALGQAIGRWGNYFNGELYGGPTDRPWGIPIKTFYEGYQKYGNASYFHPAFLYESLLNLFNFFFLLFLHKKRLSIMKESQKGVDWIHLEGDKLQRLFLKKGNIFLIYLLNYSIIRFTLEFIRIDETAMIFGFRSPQLLSVLLFIFIVLVLRIRITKNPQPII